MSSRNDPAAVHLHVIHDLGGGAAKWLSDFIAADKGDGQRVLKSLTHDVNAATGLGLYAAQDLETPLRVWSFDEPIAAAVPSHDQYRAALGEVVAEEGVTSVIVSSLIGHSLDALRTGLPTIVVHHDYFPACPAINLGSKENPFRGYTPALQAEVREGFMDAVTAGKVALVAPSRSVVDNLRTLDPRFASADFQVVEHGYESPLRKLDAPTANLADRLRILVLGQLSGAKGFELLKAALPRLTAFADLEFIGTRELGEALRGIPHVSVVSQYRVDELPALVARFNPHVGLLASIVPETYSYALSELFMLQVPVVATRIGSFAERVKDGVQGWLFEPNADALVERMRHVDRHREEIARARSALAGWAPRSAAAMVVDYHGILSRLAANPAPPTSSAPRVSPEEALAKQAATLAGLWRETKSLHLQLAVTRERDEREIADLRKQVKHLADQRDHAAVRVRSVEQLLDAKSRELDGVVEVVRHHEAALQAVYGSVSWRLLGPWRRARRGLARVGLLGSCVVGVFQSPLPFGTKARRLWLAGRNGGAMGLKTALLAYRSIEGVAVAWREYRQRLREQVLPRLAEAANALKGRPRISIVVCTFNTPADMLREALDSLLAQIYPEWELCVEDDASTEGHVARILRDYAARDARIQPRFGSVNVGVSVASNRAIARATGDYAVLMDHDDVLEEQALFRFAQCIVADAPDLLYSDEVLAEADGETAREVVYRPAFSPELLRAHPYIVHLAGFRMSLLRDVGGFDESLRISQDYDLFLRVSERVERVAHLPEPMYRWRTHVRSAGHQFKDRVTDVSTEILQRHLDRVSPGAKAAPGYGFNFYDVRYPLKPGSRVAVIIPTRDHGELLRQCITSLRATVSGIDMDVIVADNESRDPATLGYLATSPDITRVVRYEGAFNFSAINNFAIASLSADYTHYLLCNNDIEATEEGWLARMLELAQQGDIGIVGAKLLYPDRRTIQHAGVCVGAFGRAEHYGKFVRLPDDRIEGGYYGTFAISREMSAVTAALLLIRRDTFMEAGGMDESLEVGFGDVDLCLRVGALGYRVVQCSAATLIHHESMSRGRNNLHPVDSARFDSKWGEALRLGDPYFNPGFSPTDHNWGVRNPLRCEESIRRRIVAIDRHGGRQAITFSED